MTKSNQPKRGLGRGLSALMADVATQAPGPVTDGATREDTRFVPIENIAPNAAQPRRTFDSKGIQELAKSIEEKGVLQPLLVRKLSNKSNSYEIIAGERRWRAAQIAQLHELPVLVRDYSDQEVLEIAIIENVQRADLNPVEEAAGYRQLMERFGHTQEKVAQAMSKSRSHIANLMRLLSLPDGVLDLLQSGEITAGHARALVTTENPSEIANLIVARGLSVRATEQLMKKKDGIPKSPKNKSKKKDSDTIALEKDISANLKMTVLIDHQDKQGKGSVTIRYANLDQLDEICQRLSSVL